MKKILLAVLATFFCATPIYAATVGLADFTAPAGNSRFNPWAFAHAEALMTIAVADISGDSGGLRVKSTVTDRKYGRPSAAASFAAVSQGAVLVSEYEVDTSFLGGGHFQYHIANEKRDYVFDFMNSGASDAVVTLRIETGVALQAETNPVHTDDFAGAYAVANAFGVSQAYTTSHQALRHFGQLYSEYRHSGGAFVNVDSGFVETNIFYVDLFLPAGQIVRQSANFQFGTVAIAPAPGALLCLVTGLGLLRLRSRARLPA